jgi:8-oxo-dGTP pyrophosphatase MutT (NUDIX family)
VTVSEGTGDTVNPLQVRPLAICLFRNGDRILVGEGYDVVKKQVYYRPLGGAIEFGEFSHDAIVREIREELGAEITNLRYLTTLETVFTCDGQPGHEVVIVYEAAFVDKSIYEKPALSGIEDGGLHFEAVWKPLEDFLSGDPPLYPEGLLEFLLKSANQTPSDNTP